MNNILYISGDGVDSVKQRWKIYFNYFDQFWFRRKYLLALRWKNLEIVLETCFPAD